MFGIFGYLGIFKNKVQNGNSANTVMDYYTGIYTIIVINLNFNKLNLIYYKIGLLFIFRKNLYWTTYSILHWLPTILFFFQ